MTRFTCSFAGVSVAVRALYPQTERFCADYLCQSQPELCVELFPEDIAYEQAAAQRGAQKPSAPLSEPYLETLALYRKLADVLPEHNTLLFHGSAVAVDAQGYLFTAPSGTGKSTHARLWCELFGQRAFVVNDDKPLLRLDQDAVRVYGTPWDGKHHLSRNTSVPLKALCLLQRDGHNHIEPLQLKDAYVRIMAQTYRPRQINHALRMLELVDELLWRVPVYRMSCNMEPEAARVAYLGMGGKEPPEGRDDD